MTYPKRPHNFWRDFMHRLTRSGSSSGLVPPESVLLMVVALAEHDAGFSAPVAFTDTELADAIGSRADRIDHYRSRACLLGWLACEADSSGAWRYFVQVPGCARKAVRS